MKPERAFAQHHPAVLLGYFLAVLLVAMFVVNPVLQLCALGGGILFGAMLSRRQELPGDIGFYVPMFLLVSITNPLFSHNGVTPLFFLNGNPVTLEAFVYGAALGVTVIGVMLLCRCYQRVMSSDKFLYLCGRALPRLGLVLSMALRFVPRFKRQMRRVSAAQKAMGLYTSRSIVSRLQSTLRVLGAMVAWSLENALDTAASMKARGYGSGRRTQYSLFRFRAADGWLLGATLVLCGAVLAAVAAGQLRFYYYPRVSALPTSPGAIGGYVAFGGLSFLPFILEVKEALVWKYYVSRI